MNVGSVFIVDDEPLVLRATSRPLRAMGFKVAAFNSPEEFLRRCNPHAEGCLVLDVSMPGMGGLELQESLAKAGNLLPYFSKRLCRSADYRACDESRCGGFSDQALCARGIARRSQGGARDGSESPSEGSGQAALGEFFLATGFCANSAFRRE